MIPRDGFAARGTSGDKARPPRRKTKRSNATLPATPKVPHDPLIVMVNSGAEGTQFGAPPTTPRRTRGRALPSEDEAARTATISAARSSPTAPADLAGALGRLCSSLDALQHAAFHREVAQLHQHEVEDRQAWRPPPVVLLHARHEPGAASQRGQAPGPGAVRLLGRVRPMNPDHPFVRLERGHRIGDRETVQLLEHRHRVAGDRVLILLEDPLGASLTRVVDQVIRVEPG